MRRGSTSKVSLPLMLELLALDDARLLQIGFSRQKARYARALATAVAAGDLRLEALPDDSLSGKGPGHATNFVVSRVTATITPKKNKPLAGRYVPV